MPKAKLKPAIPQLPSGDLTRTAEFFQNLLGFEIYSIFPDHGHLIVGRGKAEIHFWLTENAEQAKEIASASSCYIRVKNIEELYAEFKRKGVKFRYGLTKQAWGMNEMQIDDPYGNAIRFGEQID